jgi:hypothetical protein
MSKTRARGGMLCSEILHLRLQSRAGCGRELTVNLEEIWSSGALFLTDVPIRPFTPLRFAGGGCEFRGQAIARTLLRGLGYFIEMQFHPGYAWSEQKYRPKHLFNPLVLLANRIFEGMPHPPISPAEGLLPATFAGRTALASFKHAAGRAL